MKAQPTQEKVRKKRKPVFLAVANFGRERWLVALESPSARTTFVQEYNGESVLAGSKQARTVRKSGADPQEVSPFGHLGWPIWKF